MRVILTTDVDSVGKMGEIKEVKSGMARNFLIPQKLAIRATPGNIKVWEQKSKIIQKREETLRTEAQGFASNLDGASVSTIVKVGEENKMFGSVTSQNISDLLAEQGFEVSRKSIDLGSPIKELGVHELKVKLYQEVHATITVDVQGEDADGNIVELIEEPEAPVEEQAVEEQEAQNEEIEASEEVEAASEPEAQEEAEESPEEAAEEEEQEEAPKE
ncbi:MAG: 50S ribosomal protein L9 [Thermodesulfobacteriota bacterium]